MNPQLILNSLRLPGRIDSGIAAELLGFSEHDIPVLIRGKLLKPLGNSAPNCVKYFSAVAIVDQKEDEGGLKAFEAVSRTKLHDAAVEVESLLL